MNKNLIKSDKVFKVIIIFAVIFTGAVAGVWWFWWKDHPPMAEQPKEEIPVIAQEPEKRDPPAKPQPVMDYGKLDKDLKFKDMMQKRKADYGLDEGVDMVVKSDEAIKVGGSTVSMQEILDKIRLKEGDLVEKDLKGGQPTEKTEGAADSSRETDQAGNRMKEAASEGEAKPLDQELRISFISEDPTGVYGIYVVESGDNVWNIHFEFLKTYFAKKKISLSSRADEPSILGHSSGVGKLLKFSEKMVYIYNVKEKRLDLDLNQIHPLSKIVVFNLARAFALLDQIDYRNVNRIQFDGETLWIPADQG